jgi:hypothetical protein
MPDIYFFFKGRCDVRQRQNDNSIGENIGLSFAFCLLISTMFIMLCLFVYLFWHLYHAYIGYKLVHSHTVHYILNAHNINFRLGRGVTIPPITLVWVRLLELSNSCLIIYLVVICQYDIIQSLYLYPSCKPHINLSRMIIEQMRDLWRPGNNLPWYT